MSYLQIMEKKKIVFIQNKQKKKNEIKSNSSNIHILNHYFEREEVVVLVVIDEHCYLTIVNSPGYHEKYQSPSHRIFVIKHDFHVKRSLFVYFPSVTCANLHRCTRFLYAS